MIPASTVVVRRSILFPVLVSLALHGLLGALAFWQASGWSSETPVGVDTVFAGTEDEAGTLDLLVSSPHPKADKPAAKGSAEESSADSSFVQEARVDEPSPFRETKEPGPVVTHKDQAATKDGIETTTGQGTGESGTSGNGTSRGPSSLTGGHFPTVGAEQSIVYLVDQSISMGLSGGLDVAKREVLHRVKGLPDSARFQVFFYTNHQVEPLMIDGDQGLLPASDSVKEKASALIARQLPKDGTQHLEALMTALRLKPSVIVLITDADDLSPGLVKKITDLNEQRCAIHTIELAKKRKGEQPGLLALLATRNGGRYQCLE